MVARVCEELGEAFSEVDITTDEDLQDRYGEEIPVTLVDGRQHDFWRVDETRLRAALGLTGPPSRPPVLVGHLTCAGRGRLRFCSPVHKLLQWPGHGEVRGTGKKQR